MGIANLYRNKRTARDGFIGCVQVIASLHLCIAALQTFIAAVSKIFVGYLTSISIRKVCIAGVLVTTLVGNTDIIN